MNIFLGASGTTTVTEIHIGAAGGARAVAEGWIGTPGGPRQFYSAGAPVAPLTASISPSFMYWNVVTPGAEYRSATAFDAIVSGGDGAYSYVWETSNPAASFRSPAGPSTDLDSYDGYLASVRCHVSDGAGQTASTDWASIS